MNHTKPLRLIFSLATIFLLFITNSTFSNEPDKEITIEFKKNETIRLQGLMYDGWKGKQYGDYDRLVWNTKSSASSRYALIDINNFTDNRIVKKLKLYVLVNGLSSASVMNKIIISASLDGDNFVPVPLSKDKKVKKLSGGYYGMYLNGMCAGNGFRFIKITLKNFANTPYWRLQLAKLDLTTATREQGNSRGFTKKLEFCKDEPLVINSMRYHSWKAKARGDSDRLILDSRKGNTTGSVTCDTAIYSSATPARYFQLDLVVHGYKIQHIKKYLKILVSDDAKNFTSISYKMLKKNKKLAGGFASETIYGLYSHGFRFIKIEINLPENAPGWKLQLANITLSSNKIKITDTEEGIVFNTNNKLSEGMILDLKIHRLLKKKDSFILLISKTGKSFKPVTYKLGIVKSLPAGWDEYRVLYGDANKTFRYVKFIPKHKAPQWTLKVKKIKFIKDYDQYLTDQNKQLPKYEISSQKPVEKIINCQATLIDDKNKLLDVWELISLSDSGYRSFHWKRLPITKSPQSKYIGAAYRFAVKTVGSVESKDIILRLPRSAYVSELYVDSKKIAESKEGLLPVKFNISPYIKTNKINLIELRIYNYREGFNSQGKQTLPMGAMFKYYSGLAKPPEIFLLPKLHMADIFITSDIDNGKVDVKFTVENFLKVNRKGNIKCSIRNIEGEILLKKTIDFNLASQQSMPLDISFKTNNKLKKWDIGKPNLYYADLEIIDSEAIVQKKTLRFGYRSIKTQGENIVLNGRKIRLIGPWAHVGEWTFKTAYKGRRLSTKELYKTLLSKGFNYGRLHCQPFDKNFYDSADETGFLLIAESGLNHRPANNASLTHIREMVKFLRNHPSVIIWSGSNEFEHWLVPRPRETMEFLVKVMNEIKKLDPTRPVQHSGFGDALGKLDIYNIHYPCETAVFPYCLYWKKDPQRMTNRLYLDNYKKYNPVNKKPIAYGEHAIPSPTRNLSYYAGEKALRYSYSNALSERKKLAATQGANWRKRIRAAREQNIAVLSPNIFYTGIDSPFVDELAAECAQAGAYVKHRSPIMRSGRDNKFSLAAFDDAGKGFIGTATVKIIADEKQILKKKISIKLNPGEVKEKSVFVKIPNFTIDQKGLLTVDLANQEGKTVYQDKSIIKIYRSKDIFPGLDYKVALWGSDKKIVDILKRFNIDYLVVKDIRKFLNSTQNLPLIIGPRGDNKVISSNAKKIAEYVQSGGHVLSFSLDPFPKWLPLQVATPQKETESCIGFIRSTHNKLFSNASWNIENIDLRYWGKDWKISYSSLLKPSSGNFFSLIDGSMNLEQVYLLEIPYGKGMYLSNQLALLKKYESVPQASRLLYNLLKYFRDYKSTPMNNADFLAAPDSYSAVSFKHAGWNLTKSPQGGHCIGISNESIKYFGIKKCIEISKIYKNILFFNLPQKSVLEISKALTGTIPKINYKFAKKKLYFTGMPDNVYEGLTSRDINWKAKTQMSYSFASGSNWKSSIAPGCDAIFSKGKGKGKIIFLSLPFNIDIPDYEHKQRFIAQLSTNLDIKCKGKRVKNLNPNAKFKSIDISSQANASIKKYLGKNAPSDKILLSGIPFKLIRESGNTKNSMIRLNGRCGTTLGNKKIIYDTPIDRFSKKTPEIIKIPLNSLQVDSLYFSHAITLNWKIHFSHGKGNKVCIYKVNYRDGSSIECAVSNNINIGVCRSPTSPSKAKLSKVFANSANGEGERAAIYVWEWDNPYPEKKIRNIEIKSAKNPSMDIMIFGISAKIADSEFI